LDTLRESAAAREQAEPRLIYLHGDFVPSEGRFLCRCCDLFQPAAHFREHPKDAHIARYRASLALLSRLSRRGAVRGGAAETNLISKAFRVARTHAPHPSRPPRRKPIIVREYAIERVLPRLPGLKQTGPQTWMAKCPAHEDRTPSLSVRLAGDRVLLYCFAGCEVGDITAAIGLELRDLFDSVRAA
jgi:hypothetical protein